MPPGQKAGCQYDEADWKSQVEDTLWRSKDSHSSRLTALESRAESTHRWVTLVLPIIFTVVTTGLFLLLQVVKDFILK